MKILLRWMLLPALSLMMAACANPGTPDGGPYDETPPHVVGSNPVFGKIDETGRKIEIRFDEMVQLNKASEKVTISPPQLNMPDIAALGKKIRIKLQDSLKANTTYTIDFSDAIVDNNEGNPLGNYTFVFSTGQDIDTMEVAGNVLNAFNLEPVKGMVVGLCADTVDSAFTKVPLLRVARTDSRGRFIIRGVKHGTYRVCALNDADGDFRYSQKSEMVAVLPQLITTGSFPDLRADTVWHDSLHIDSIRYTPFTHYTPDDLVLLAYTETAANRHLLKTERQEPRHFEIYFTGPSTQAPKLRGLNMDAGDEDFVIDRTIGNDTLCYWFKDTIKAYCDTLVAALTYMENDSAGQFVERIDTLEFVPKITRERQRKWEADAYKKWQKEQNKLKKRGQPYEEVRKPEPYEVEIKSSSLAPNENLTFTFKEPLARLDTSLFHLYLKRDTVLEEAEYLFRQEGGSSLKHKLYGEWRPMQKYRLVMDSAAFRSIYGRVSKAANFDFSIPSLDTYSTLLVKVSGAPDSLSVVQLLNSSEKVVGQSRVENGNAEFFFVRPGRYYLRLFVDDNGNGKWDEGCYDQHRQPEKTYYYPEAINLKAMWDITQDWDVNAMPLVKQKPLEITKQKPDRERQRQNKNEQRNFNNRNNRHRR